mgnify:CR=1 FL=1
MPVFYNEKILYLHIPKCGGLSVTSAARAGLPGYYEPGVKRKDHKPGLPIGHIRADDFEGFTGIPLNSFEVVFATIRDPVECEWSKWNFWRRRYYMDTDSVKWRHPADRYCWEHSFYEYVENKIEPFNDWYVDSILPAAEKNYNEVGRFNWWINDYVELYDINDTEGIQSLLKKYGCTAKVRHLHRTGVGEPALDQATQRHIREVYGEIFSR